jgi:hypothetical protein
MQRFEALPHTARSQERFNKVFSTEMVRATTNAQTGPRLTDAAPGRSRDNGHSAREKCTWRLRRRGYFCRFIAAARSTVTTFASLSSWRATQPTSSGTHAGEGGEAVDESSDELDQSRMLVLENRRRSGWMASGSMVQIHLKNVRDRVTFD